MRTFKFRAWSFTDKKFYDRVCVGNTYTDDPCSIVWVSDEKGWVNFDKHCGVIQQFTGLKDSRGVDVYEGDIVKFSKPTGTVHPVWDYLTKDLKQIRYGLDGGQFPDAGFVAISLEPADLEDGKILNHMDQSHIEVVGNIFENENAKV